MRVWQWWRVRPSQLQNVTASASPGCLCGGELVLLVAMAAPAVPTCSAEEGFVIRRLCKKVGVKCIVTELYLYPAVL